MISRRTLVLLGLAALLFAIPQAYHAGERADCHAHNLARGKAATNQPNSASVYFDECSMVDFGMYDWMRYAILVSIVMLVASAYSYRMDRTLARERDPRVNG